MSKESEKIPLLKKKSKNYRKKEKGRKSNSYRGKVSVKSKKRKTERTEDVDDYDEKEDTVTYVIFGEHFPTNAIRKSVILIA